MICDVACAPPPISTQSPSLAWTLAQGVVPGRSRDGPGVSRCCAILQRYAATATRGTTSNPASHS